MPNESSPETGSDGAPSDSLSEKCWLKEDCENGCTKPAAHWRLERAMIRSRLRECPLGGIRCCALSSAHSSNRCSLHVGSGGVRARDSGGGEAVVGSGRVGLGLEDLCADLRAEAERVERLEPGRKVDLRGRRALRAC